jgi:hypothetical protein
MKLLVYKIKDDPELMFSFQDDLSAKNLPNTDYFFTFIKTLTPDYLSKVIRTSKAKRFKHDEDE